MDERKRPPRATQVFNRFASHVAGRRFAPVWALVHHVGRKSGRAYTTPVAVIPTAGVFYVGLPWGRESDWVRNLRAEGGGTMDWRGRSYDVSDPTFRRQGRGAERRAAPPARDPQTVVAH